MPTTCAVFGCHSVYEKGVKITFHTFPKDEDTRQKWITACRRGDFINPTAAHMCNRHFEDNAYERNLMYELLEIPLPSKQRRLRPGAVPTLHLPIVTSKKC